MRHTNFNVLLIILLSTPMTSDVKQNQDNTLYEDIFFNQSGLNKKDDSVWLCSTDSVLK